MKIQDLIDEARGTMLRSGHVMPMVHIQLETHYLFLALDILNDNQSVPTQCGLLARMAWEHCKQYPEEKPIAVGMYAEAWISTNPKDDQLKMRPKLDPDRREVLGVEIWQAKANQCQHWRFPVIRERQGNVKALGEAEKSENMSWQLASIVQGVRDSQRPDEEVISTLKGAISKKMATMTPEKKRELMKFLRQEGIPFSLDL